MSRSITTQAGGCDFGGDWGGEGGDTNKKKKKGPSTLPTQRGGVGKRLTEKGSHTKLWEAGKEKKRGKRPYLGVKLGGRNEERMIEGTVTWHGGGGAEV